MNIPKKLSIEAYKSLVKQGVIERLLDSEISAVRDWRFAYELEGGPELRKAKKSENPWRPWAEAMVKWACTPPFQPFVGSMRMEDYFQPVLTDLYSELATKDYRSAWRLFSADVPDFLMSHEFLIKMAIRGSIKPDLLPLRLQNADDINAIALQNDLYVEEYPNLITHETALALCTRDGSRLRRLDDRLRTEDVVDAAINSCSFAFEAAPESLKTSMRCLEQVRLHKSLGYIPEALVTQEMCDIAIANNLTQVEYAPVSMITRKNVLQGAISDPGKVAKYAPEGMVDAIFIEEVIRANPRGIYALSDREVTDEMILASIKRNVLNYQHIRSHRITEEMSDLLVSLRADAFPMLTEKHRTLNRVLSVIDRFPYAIGFVKMESISNEDMLKAVRADYKILALLPKDRVTPEMDLEALRQNGELLRMVNVENRTPEICLVALTGSDLAWSYVPKRVQANPGFKVQALRINPALSKRFGGDSSLEM